MGQIVQSHGMHFFELAGPDLLLGFTPGAAGPVLRLYRNDGGRFTDQTASSGLVVATGAVRQPAWVDADGDGAISQAEAGHFWPELVQADADKDGLVTEAELKAAIAAGIFAGPPPRD